MCSIKQKRCFFITFYKRLVGENVLAAGENVLAAYFNGVVLKEMVQL